ncbi:MAG: T9SS type A sorting domain-containing protein, partial [Bacteroidota bacterium]
PDTPPTSVRTLAGPEEGLRVYPNPFTDNTRVQFTLAQAQNIELGVYDKLGREVQRITNGFRPAGANEVVLNNEVLTPGIYVIRLVGEHSRFTHKVVVR